MKRFTNLELQQLYDQDSSFRSKVDKTEVQYQLYLQKADQMEKDQRIQESFLEKFVNRKGEAIYFFYGFLQPSSTKNRTKTTLNFLQQFAPDPQQNYHFVYFNHNTPNSDSFREFKNIFMLLPLAIIQKMASFVLVKPYFFIRALEYVAFGGPIDKFFNKRYSTVENCADLCKKLEINVHDFASFVPQVISEEFPPSFVRKPSLSTYRINVQGQNMSEEERKQHKEFEQTIQNLIKKDGFRLQDYQVGELGIPVIFQVLVGYFHNRSEGLNEQGIFRKCVSIDEQSETLAQLCKRNYQYLQSINNPHLIASLIKKFFHNLKEPIFPFPAFEKLMHDQGISDKKEYVKGIVWSLPRVNRLTISYLIDFLKKEIVTRSNINKMPQNNLAICFSPCLMRSEKPSTADLIYASKAVFIVNLLISEFDAIFGNEEQRQAEFKLSMAKHTHQFQQTIKIELKMQGEDEELDSFVLEDRKQSVRGESEMFYSISTIQQNEEPSPKQEESIPKEQEPKLKEEAQVGQKKEKRKMSLEQVSKELKEIQRRFTERKKSSSNEPTTTANPSTELADEGTQCFVLQFGQEGTTSFTQHQRQTPSTKKSGKAVVGWGDLEVKW